MVKYSRDQSTEAPRRFIWSSDGGAVVALPLPDAFDEGLAAELLAVGAFAVSWRSTIICVAMPAWSVPGPRGRRSAAHAMPAGEDVHLRLVEHVAHVQAAGDVGRGQQDGEGLGLWAGREA
jgi:hypothetical protein